MNVIELGSTIGPYKLVRQIGEGTTSVVFAAEQYEPICRRVALKVIRPGTETREVLCRFEVLPQVIALMDHPNIVKVIHAGTTESGVRFCATELVDGRPITHYCDLNHCSIEQRLRLFVAVCNAVQHVHQRQIIHNQVNPSHVLVGSYDSGVMKLIGFGRARALPQWNQVPSKFVNYRSPVIGPPEYASPEQSLMSAYQIDTRSDVYSLGVLMYELLTSTTPFRSARLASQPGTATDLARDKPVPPSELLSKLERLSQVAENRSVRARSLRRQLRGDLDSIAMKATEWDRVRRYATAGLLASDVQHYLNNEPTLARPRSSARSLFRLLRGFGRP
jgi:serine/threonine protein kinase